MTGIYLIKNITNSKYYIGSAVNIQKRISNHIWALKNGKHCNRHLQSAWKKDGSDSFIFEEHLICKKNELVFYEQLVMDAFAARYGWTNLYNLSPTAGSSLGRRHTEETKRKIGKASKGRWLGRKHTKETKEKISLGNKGKKHSEETKRKLSKAKTGKKLPPFTEEHKKRISIANMGHTVSAETREKLRIANTGKHLTEETKKKIGDAFRGKPGTRLGIKNKIK